MFDITAFNKPLDSKLHSKYIEQLVFLLLGHILPEFSRAFIQSDAPDLQAKDKSIGIEITEAVSPKFAQINGEYAKLRFGKDSEHEKDECKRKIVKNGGSIDTIGLSYPVTNSNEDWVVFSSALSKKLELLPSYREKGFGKIGLFIYFDEPPIPFDPAIAMERFAKIQSGSDAQYDFLFFGYRCGVIGFDFYNQKLKIYTIDTDVFDDLSLRARKMVEGLK